MTYLAQAPGCVLCVSGWLTGNPFLSIISSIHFRRRPVRSEGDRSSGLYTCSIIVQNSSDTSSTDIRSFPNKIAIKLWVIRTTEGPAAMSKAHPPVPLPPIRSKCSQGSIPAFDSSDSLSQFNRCIIFLIISSWDIPRTPPPSIGRKY
jgi:hypothetical protein